LRISAVSLIVRAASTGVSNLGLVGFINNQYQPDD
jgi:hypothetical protein